MYAQQAATGMTTGVINYWEGSQFGAFGMGTSVCLGYSKAYTYLVQCLDKDIYLKDTNAAMTAPTGRQPKNCTIQMAGLKNYTVDLVRISFQSDVTMYGEEQDFGSDHYWNAVKVDDPVVLCGSLLHRCLQGFWCDRVETDGDMNHTYFLFSDTSARKLYDGNSVL